MWGEKKRETKVRRKQPGIHPQSLNPPRSPNPSPAAAAPRPGGPPQLTVAKEALLVQHGYGIDDEERGLQQRVEGERHGPAGRHRERHREQQRERERRPRETWRGGGRSLPSGAGVDWAGLPLTGGSVWGLMGRSLPSWAGLDGVEPPLTGGA